MVARCPPGHGNHWGIDVAFWPHLKDEGKFHVVVIARGLVSARPQGHARDLCYLPHVGRVAWSDADLLPGRHTLF